uniref:Monothiol glutaredoxin-5, mitochondrial n=1 Tax=Glaciozyma antarctica TaxID=105987 RepID=I1E4C3_9BASI|nr:monothiol glutaredoxin [Glaciozyma antarctica]
MFSALRQSSRSSLTAFSASRLLSSPRSATLLRALSTEARSKIDGAVKAHPIVLFMKGTPDLPQCGFSRAVCQILEVQGVKPEKMNTFNCLEDAELREGIKEFSSWPTIPQLYLDGEFIGGCDIVLAMHQSGELEEAFLKAGVVDPLPEVPEAPKA